MLYLSRLIIDLQHQQVRRDLADCHRFHQRILSAFNAAPDPARAREHFGVLYRSEGINGTTQQVRVLVQSAMAPDWEKLPIGYCGPAIDARGNPAVRLISEEYDAIKSGMEFQFRLRANPTKRISARNPSQEERWHTKRVELRREEDQLAWLARKGEQGGFALLGCQAAPELPDLRVLTQEKVHGQRRQHGAETPMRLSFGAVLFEGRLQVTDQPRFLATLRDGLGSGKAFGFGLLSIASLA